MDVSAAAWAAAADADLEAEPEVHAVGLCRLTPQSCTPRCTRLVSSLGTIYEEFKNYQTFLRFQLAALQHGRAGGYGSRFAGRCGRRGWTWQMWLATS